VSSRRALQSTNYHRQENEFPTKKLSGKADKIPVLSPESHHPRLVENLPLSQSLGPDRSTPNLIQSLFAAGTTTGITDRQLLERFLAHRDETAEAAFSALVYRHGAMVWRICLQLLGDVQAAEDAFQATFLVLARKAGRIRQPELLGPWLFGVARCVAREAIGQGNRGRRLRDLARTDLKLPGAEQRPDVESARREEFEALHEELGRLPETYRQPIVLCYFEGLTHEQAANLLRCPVGTVSVRLQRARKLLGERLTRRGLAPAALLLTATTASETVGAAVQPALAASTIQAVRSGITHHTLATEAAALAEGVLQTMFWNKTKVAVLAAVAISLVATVSIVGIFRVSGATQLTAKQPTQQKAAGLKHQDNPVQVLYPENQRLLSPRTQSRLAIARQLRDQYYALYLGGEVDLEKYLLWQGCYSDVIASEGGRGAKDFEPVELLEAEVKGIQSLEKRIKELVQKNEAPKRDALVVEFFRMDAEEKLERAKSDRDHFVRKTQINAPTPSSTIAPPPFRR
jgi:RNA polymerase sigma factor (sigma-70 family)